MEQRRPGPRVPAAQPEPAEPHRKVDVLIAPANEACVEPVHRLEIRPSNACAKPVRVPVRRENREGSVARPGGGHAA